MKKGIVKILGFVLVPAGALFFNGCGVEEMNDSEPKLAQTSDNWTFYNGVFSEYGHCNNAQDDNGNGLVDGVDPDCHVNPGPLRDLSLFDFPIGHNYLPFVPVDWPGGPGYLGSFRDPELFTRWFRFLTEPDGWIAGLDVLTPGWNPEVVPIPAPLPVDIDMGTWHPGNNNNLSIRAMHVWDMYHPGPLAAGTAPAAPGDAASKAPSAPAANIATTANDPTPLGVDESSNYLERVYTLTRGIPGGSPGEYYRAKGPFGGSGVLDLRAKGGF